MGKYKLTNLVKELSSEDEKIKNLQKLMRGEIDVLPDVESDEYKDEDKAKKVKDLIDKERNLQELSNDRKLSNDEFVRITGFMNTEDKNKFISLGTDLINQATDQGPFFIDDVLEALKKLISNAYGDFEREGARLNRLGEEKKGGNEIKITQDQMDKLHKGEIITITHMDSNGNKIKSNIAFTGKNLKEMTADEFGGDEESVARISKFQNKSPEQVRQEVSDIEYEEIADKLGKNLPPMDRSKFTKAGLGRMIVDLVYDGDLEKALDAIDSKNLKEMKNKREIEKELEKIENLDEMKVDTGMFIDDDEFEMEMVKDKAKEIQPLFPDVSMEDLIDFVKTHRQDIKGMSDEEIKDEYREYQSVNVPSPSDFMEEDKALREHFGRFLKDYQ